MCQQPKCGPFVLAAFVKANNDSALIRNVVLARRDTFLGLPELLLRKDPIHQSSVHRFIAKRRTTADVPPIY